MSCNESDLIVERHVELPASPDVVWDELAEMLGDEVELAAEPGGVLHADDARRRPGRSGDRGGSGRSG